jgi:phosphatidylethanolamine/phosphatidyl-N-methylethanolamine N-methyltransferase
MQPDAVRAAYRRYAPVYDTLFGPVLQPGRNAVMQALGCLPGERVLEVGVGTGLSLPLYPDYVRLTGIDMSSEMLDKARTRIARRNLTNVDALLEMDAENMTFPDGAFDRVVAMYVVSVVEQPARLLHELKRVCRPGGEIFIVNHVRSKHPIIGAVEKHLARFSAKLGFHPDFELGQMINGSARLEEIATVNFFWKVLRLRNV